MPRRKHLTPRYRLARHGATWEVRWTEDGRSKRVSCRTADADEAQRFFGAFIAGRGSVPESPAIGAMIEAYWQDHGRHTLASYNLRLRLERLGEHFGHVEPAHVNAALVRAYHARRQSAGIGAGSIALECRTLATVLSWARKQGWIATAPYIPRPKPPAPRDRFLTRAEAERLIEGAGDPHVRLFILIGLHTGARKGAILGLTWERVNLDTLKIDFNEPGRPLTQKRRSIAPINDTLRAALLEASERALSEHVIEYGGKPVGCIDYGFGKACERAGLEGVSPHVLRHTAASRMAQAGIPLWTAAKILGMSANMLDRVYAHYDSEYGREAVRALEG